ncbi:MAG: class I SAM-dependent methyltransferase [Myxococcota bacterium]
MSTAWQALRGHAGRVVRRVWQAQDHGELIAALLAKVQPIRDHRLVFVETGCGNSTLALAEVARRTGALVYTCDLDKEKLERLRERTRDPLTEVTLLAGDSLDGLAEIVSRHGRIDFALLDSAPSATHTLREFLLLEPRFGPGSRLLIDDAALPGARLLLGACRKGKLIVPYLLASPFWTVTAHPRAGDSMVSGVLDAIGARADTGYEDPSYVDLWRASFDRRLRPVPAS